MFQCYRKGTSFASGLIAIAAVALIAIAIGTKEWVRADIVRTINQHVNGSGNKIDGGYKYFGLFNGCEEKRFGPYYGPRRRCFDALEEVKSFADINKVYATLACSCIAIVILIASAYLSFYVELVKSIPEWLDPFLLNIVNGAAFAFALIAVGLYAELYINTFKQTVLPDSDLKDGFSTEGKSQLRYSYWLLVAVCGLCLCNLMFVCVASCKRSKTKLFLTNLTKSRRGGTSVSKHANGDGAGMMLY